MSRKPSSMQSAGRKKAGSIFLEEKTSKLKTNFSGFTEVNKLNLFFKSIKNKDSIILKAEINRQQTT
jgi:hypothetical protein